MAQEANARSRRMKVNLWDHYEISYLRDHWDSTKSIKIAKRLKRTEASITTKASVLGLHRSKETRRKFYIGMKRPPFTDLHKKRMRESHLKRKYPFKDTTIEVKMQIQLQERKIVFTKHKTLTGRPDIFIEPNICIFADGCYWHSCPIHFKNGKYKEQRVQKDPQVNQKLVGQGYKVLRFWEHEINSNVDYCINVIKKVKSIANNKERTP